MNAMQKHKKPLILLAVLSVAVAIFFMLNSKEEEGTFKRDFIEIDTAQVTAIVIYPKSQNGNEIQLSRTAANNWKLMTNGKVMNADEAMPANILEEIMQMTAQRIVGTSAEKQAEYEVIDTAATRVKFMAGSLVVLDMFVGKFTYTQSPQTANFQQPNIKITSYVRLAENNEIYAVEGFVSMLFNRDVNSFRNKNILNSDAQTWKRLSFNYKGDSSFVLIRQQDKWTINGMETDSSVVNSYLSSLVFTTSQDFYEGSVPSVPTYQLKVESSGFSPIEIMAFQADTLHHYFIQSSQNKGVTFADVNNTLVKKIFKSRTELLPLVK